MSTTKETIICCWIAAFLFFGSLAYLIGPKARGQTHPSGAPDLYRFSVIRIAKGTIVETRDGKYIALEDEIWVSEKQFIAVQKEQMKLAEMLAQAQRRRN